MIIDHCGADTFSKREKAKAELFYLYNHVRVRDTRFKIGDALGKANEEIFSDEILRYGTKYLSDYDLSSVFYAGTKSGWSIGDLKISREARIKAGRALGCNPLTARVKILVNDILSSFRA